MLANTIYVLSREPLVLMGGFGTLEQAAALPGNFTFIFHNAGGIRARTLRRYVLARLRYRGSKRLIVVTNEPSEARWLRLINVEALCLSQNLHVRELIYTYQPKVPRRYDAVYAAQLLPFKRLHLAAEVRSLFVLTYASGKTTWDMHDYEPRLRHADFNRTWMPVEEVVNVYGQARVGLALSSREGAMLATLEYLFCGLPIVSTHNRGGRNRYLTAQNSRFVAADPAAVAQAVAEFKAAPPDPITIRGEALRMVHQDRLSYVRMLASRCGVSFPSPEKEVERIWGGVAGVGKYAFPIGEVGRRITEMRWDDG